MINRQHVLQRRRINNELHNIMQYPFTIAIADMGYGKSTVTSEFLKASGTTYAYLSIEGEETSPQYIWDSLARQLSKTNPELGHKLCRLGFPTDYVQFDKVLKVIDEFVYNHPLILVIDDYHLCQSNPFDRLMERIIRRIPEGLHIVILSRAMPELNVEELILKGYCYQIKSDLFELNTDEIIEFFKLYEVSITSDEAEQIYHISEGWIAAIYLIMQRYTRISRIETGRNIEKLIETTVISRYSAEEVSLLKALSVLESFAPAQAAFVSNNVKAEWMIQKLSYGNSFIRYDEQGQVYRIHNIFRNFLRKLLIQAPLDTTEEELLKRAGIWLIQNRDILSGLNYLLKAKEYDLILKEFENTGITEIIDSNPGYILDLFEYIPKENRYHYPIGYLAYIGFYVTNVDRDKGSQLLDELEDYTWNTKNIAAEMQKRMKGEIELIRAYIKFNDLGEMLNQFKISHAILEGRSVVANKGKIITFGSPHVLYMYYKEKGKLRWTKKAIEGIYPYYRDLSGGCGLGFEYLLRAEYNLETGNLEEAQRNAYKAIYKAEMMEQVSIIICAKLVLGRIFIAKGRFDEAYESMDGLNVEVEACNSPILSSAFDLCIGYIGGISEETMLFANWLRMGDMGYSDVLYQGMGFNHIIYGKYLLLNHNYLKLEILCEEMQRVFGLFENQLGYLHMYLMDAIAKYNLYGMKEAQSSFDAALEIGRSDGLILTISEYGPYILPLFEQLSRQDKKGIYLDQLVSNVKIFVNNLKCKRNTLKEIPHLTEREKEILQMIVEGKINRTIALELCIAEVTVRKNITSIYRKLAVNGRAAAVKKALQLFPEHYLMR